MEPIPQTIKGHRIRDEGRDCGTDPLAQPDTPSIWSNLEGDLAKFGLVGFGQIWSDLVRFGQIRYDLVRFGFNW